MNKRSSTWLVVLLLPAACQYIPGTKDNVRVKAQQKVAEMLYDPSSAQFRNVAVLDSGKARATCGEINGKNRMGAYVGFTRFLVRADGNAMIEPGSGETYDDYSEAEKTCLDLEQGEGSWSCRHAREIMDEIAAGVAFHNAWEASCRAR